MRVSKLVALAGALAAASLARSARASELSWEGAPDCPDRGQLLFELERALGKPLSEALQTVDHLHVMNNPHLAPSVFENVRTFSSEMQGNLEATAP